MVSKTERRRLAKRLREFLRWKGWGVGDLAQAANLDHSTISKIASGSRSAGLEAATAIEALTAGWPEGAIKAADWIGSKGARVAHATRIRRASAASSSRSAA